MTSFFNEIRNTILFQCSLKKSPQRFIPLEASLWYFLKKLSHGVLQKFLSYGLLTASKIVI